MTRHLAIAARGGKVKHIPVWHPTGRGAASLCRHYRSPASYKNGAWQLAWIDARDAPVWFDYEDTIDRPWCKYCIRTVLEMVDAVGIPLGPM